MMVQPQQNRLASFSITGLNLSPILNEFNTKLSQYPPTNHSSTTQISVSPVLARIQKTYPLICSIHVDKSWVDA